MTDMTYNMTDMTDMTDNINNIEFDGQGPRSL